MASKVEEEDGIVPVPSIKFVSVVLVQISRQRFCLGEEVDLPGVAHVKHFHDKATVDVLKLESPLYRYGKADLDNADTSFVAHGASSVSEGGEQCDQTSA